MKYRNLKTLSARQLIRERKERGFTLIELVIVLAVLGVLAAIGIPQLTGLQDQAELQGAATNAASEIGNLFARDLAVDELDGSGDSGVNWSGGDVCDEVSNSDINALGEGDFTISDGSDGVEITVPTIDDGEIGQTTCDFDFVD
ncbi:prepilin-type N-terminal cleavage/methylation domain-containing protein [Spiribacter sp. 2438]|uniref:type II secretion system protein n=1 Tax=Spiribacter sp. 2438 TaxID=2666185 RepID=UPI0012AF2BDA|nr:type II secretion system protein [Spiribacter sp. 2438]QGM21544.1 prepilin-type N-terminal cleavage/methylation domain-containing protein [Spiribacter sp. 2438]